MTRRAITKHLRVLGSAGLVRGRRSGECLFEIKSKPLEEIRDYLKRVSQQWDEVARLKTFVVM